MGLRVIDTDPKLTVMQSKIFITGDTSTTSTLGENVGSAVSRPAGKSSGQSYIELADLSGRNKTG